MPLNYFSENVHTVYTKFLQGDFLYPVTVYTVFRNSTSVFTELEKETACKSVGGSD